MVWDVEVDACVAIIVGCGDLCTVMYVLHAMIKSWLSFLFIATEHKAMVEAFSKGDCIIVFGGEGDNAENCANNKSIKNFR